MKLNETIRARRRERGLTQEQVAQALGVSTPAVHKWERGICCPDITLLPPLARLLGVDLNTLLSFQEDLTPQEIGAISNQIYEQIRAQGFAAGYETAMEKLREFPSCGLLCYQLAAVLRGALFLCAPEQTEVFQPKLDVLFERAAQSEEREVREAALGMLVARAAEQEDYERAEELLDQLPDPPGQDKELMRAKLYRKEKKYDEALVLLERKLLQTVTRLSDLLGSLMEIALAQGRAADAETYAALERETALRYDLMPVCAELPAFQMAVGRQDAAACAQALEGVLAALERRWDLNASPLYRHIPGKNGEETFSAALVETMVKQLETDEELAFARSDPDFARVLARFAKR